MRTAYLYKLRLTKSQIATMESWLELLRRQYNYRLGERFSWWEQNRTPVNACPLVCYLPVLRDRPDYYSQQADLVNFKALFPEYKAVHSQVLQDCIKRVDLAYERFVVGDSNGNRSGKPRFKGAGRYRSFTFPQIKGDAISGNKIKLPSFGWVKFVNHRAIPVGFVVKTATISKKGDVWHMSLSLEDKSVPALIQPIPTAKNTIGIDLGLKSFLTDSEGCEVPIPQFFRKSEEKLAEAQRAVSRKQKGSNRHKKAQKRVAKIHQKTRNQRKDFHFKVAKSLVDQGRNIAHEDLNIRGLARTRLAKSVNDAGWGEFIQILSYKAERAGLQAITVNPNGTTQECSGCGVTVRKELSDRWHECPHCGTSLDRDHNAAINIKKRAIGQVVPAAPKKAAKRSRKSLVA